MQLEQIVTSLEVSKKLDIAIKKANIKVEPLFWWVRNPDEKNFHLSMFRNQEEFEESDEYCGGVGISSYLEVEIEIAEEFYPALTASEIGEIFYNLDRYDLFIKAYGDVFNFKGTSWVGEIGIVNLMRKPDMGAEMLCYLINNNLLNK